MLKISDTLNDLLKEDQLLNFGLNHQLLNLSQTAKFIKPLIEARLQKEVQVPAIVTSLARYQKAMNKTQSVGIEYCIENLNIQSNLATLSFNKSNKVHERLDTCYQDVRKKKGYFALTEGTSQITLITERKYIDFIKETIQEKPIFQHQQISGVSVRFAKKYLDFPGLSYHLMQKLTMQNVNLVEYSSTCTEITFFVDDNQVSLAFETLRTSF